MRDRWRLKEKKRQTNRKRERVAAQSERSISQQNAAKIKQWPLPKA